jgi:UDPglucose 6-dehydrogenase
LPTPLTAENVLDQSLIEEAIVELKEKGYPGVIAIKSTIMPGTTEKLIKSTGLDICFVPEFLRERCATEDFIKNHKLLVVGTTSARAFQVTVDSHGHLPKYAKQLLPIEAEILKFYNNTFNALRVVFANIMYDLCEKNNADYLKIKETFLLRQTASDHYMDCNENMRGYGGMCLPKDVVALKNCLEENDINNELFQAIDNDNKKFKITTFSGMRS